MGYILLDDHPSIIIIIIKIKTFHMFWKTFSCHLFHTKLCTKLDSFTLHLEEWEGHFTSQGRHCFSNNDFPHFRWAPTNLVGVLTPLKNTSQFGSVPQIGVNIKNIWNHHLDIYYILRLTRKPVRETVKVMFGSCPSTAIVDSLEVNKDPRGKSWIDFFPRGYQVYIQ